MPRICPALPQFPTVLPFRALNGPEMGNTVGNCGGGRPLAVAVPPAVRSHFASGSCPQVHGSQVQSTHVQFGLSHFVLGFSHFVLLLVGYHREGGDFSLAVLV